MVANRTKLLYRLAVLGTLKNLDVTIQIFLQEPGRVSDLAISDQLIAHPSIDRRFGDTEVFGGFFDCVPAWVIVLLLSLHSACFFLYQKALAFKPKTM